MQPHRQNLQPLKPNHSSPCLPTRITVPLDLGSLFHVLVFSRPALLISLQEKDFQLRLLADEEEVGEDVAVVGGDDCVEEGGS